MSNTILISSIKKVTLCQSEKPPSGNDEFALERRFLIEKIKLPGNPLIPAVGTLDNFVEFLFKGIYIVVDIDKSSTRTIDFGERNGRNVI